jgi:hypothetical protein
MYALLKLALNPYQNFYIIFYQVEGWSFEAATCLITPISTRGWRMEPRQAWTHYLKRRIEKIKNEITAGSYSAFSFAKKIKKLLTFCGHPRNLI